MFDPYCPICRTRTLVGFRQLKSLDNTREGIVLRFSCPCGGEAALVTGRLARAPLASPGPSAESPLPVGVPVSSLAAGRV